LVWFRSFVYNCFKIDTMVNIFNPKTLIALQIIASIIGIIWISIQLYDYFRKKNESTLFGK
jgi:hypothetical protein